MKNNQSSNRTELLRQLRIDTARAFDLYAAGEYVGAVEELKLLMDGIRTGNHDKSNKEILQYNLHYSIIGFQASALELEPEKFLTAARELAELLQLPAQTEAGEAERRAVYLRFLTSMDSAGFEQISNEEFEKLLKDVPQEMQDVRFWHDVSLWAFHRSNIHALEAAVECALMHQTKYKRESIWQRVLLMYKLVRNEAGDREIRQYLQSMEGKPQFEEFHWNILPVIREKGLWNVTLESELENNYELARTRGFITEFRD
jgi:hypothetical protein